MALVPFSKTTSPAPADPYDHEEDLDDGARMSFLEHLDELRRRLFVCVGALVVGFLVAFLFLDRIFDFVMGPLKEVLPGKKLIYTEPTEAFMLYMKVAALIGVFLAAPVILWQIWKFVAPGLYAHEKRFAIPFVLFSTGFFVAGAVFSHYLLFPWAWKFFAGFSNENMEFLPRIAPVFSLYVRLMLAMGLVFELPTLVLFLARIGLVTASTLIRHVKYAVLAMFVLAAVLTPGGDVVSQALMAAPMIGLYGFSIIVAWIVQKRDE